MIARHVSKRRVISGAVLPVMAALVLLCFTAVAAGQSEDVLKSVVPQADRIGPATGHPPVHPAYRDGKLIAHAFFTKDVNGATGYLARPLNLAIGLGLDGAITGVRIVEHHEPILTIGVSDKDLAAFVERYAGLKIGERVQVRAIARPGEHALDGIAGATISSVALHDAIIGSARQEIGRAHV